MLLLKAFIEHVTEDPSCYEQLPHPDEPWDLLVRIQAVAPASFDRVLLHPYTGTWISHLRKLIHHEVDLDRPIWTHIGYFHTLAAAAAIHAGIDFETQIPAGESRAMLPTIGLAHLPSSTSWSVATVRSAGGEAIVSTATERVRIPRGHTMDAPGWWGLRQVVTDHLGYRLSVHLDDLDPYRGTSKALPPSRIDDTELCSWNDQLRQAWQLIVRHLPSVADEMEHGLTSLVPHPPAPFRNQSGSTSEAFGSATVERPPDAASLAATLVHEFGHIRLNGLLHLVSLYDGDARQRFYTLWRDDPRPIGGTLHGIYSFFGVAAFWRNVAITEPDNRRALFEFAYWRSGTWRTLQALLKDHGLTNAGRRFVEAMADQLEPWQHEPVPTDIADMVESARADHYAGWRLRHIRPPRKTVVELADAWQAGRPPTMLPDDIDPDPSAETDGTWPGARTDLLRFSVTEPDRSMVNDIWPIVNKATTADIHYVSGKFTDAIHEYKQELEIDPDCASAWVGLGLALYAANNRSTNLFLRHPELVRAVHQELCSRPESSPAPHELVSWFGSDSARSHEES
jgi:HEXXH motif-containing protein